VISLNLVLEGLRLGLKNLQVGEKRVSDDCSYLCKGLRLDNIGQKEKSVEYLLLRSNNKLKANDIWRVTNKPESMSNQELINTGYQNPSCKNYLIYKIEKIENSAFSDIVWNIEKLPSYKSIDNKYKPFTTTLSELSQATI
jgi:hypothetical protein